MEPIRERIEDFMQRYGYEENRVLRVLAVAVAILLVLRVRVLRVLAAPMLIVAMCCTVLRSRWCQSDVKWYLEFRRCG